MTTSNPSFNQIRERSTGEKSSQPRWLFPFLFLGANLVIATGLVVLRVAGWLQVEQSFIPLLLTGVLLSGSAVLVLVDLHRRRMMLSLEERKHLFTLGLVVPVLVGMLAVHPTSGLSLPGIYFFCLAYFMAFAGVLEWLNREATQSRESELLAFHDCSSTEVDQESSETHSAATSTDNEALFAALLGQGESALCESEPETGDENCFQWMNRSVNQAGEETVEGGIRVHFQKNQRIQVVHLGLNPPLEGVLSVTSEVEDGAGMRTRVLESRPYGVSIEVKRTQDLNVEFQGLLHYQITSCNASEDVA